MINFKAEIDKIREQLGITKPTHKFIQVTTTDGTTYEADSLEVGSQIYAVDENGDQTPVEAGDYTTDDCTISVDADGTITAVTDIPDADATTEEEEMAAAVTDTPDATDDDKDASILDVLKALSAKIDAIVTDIEALKGGKPAATATAMKKTSVVNTAFKKTTETPKNMTPAQERAYKFRILAEQQATDPDYKPVGKMGFSKSNKADIFSKK